MSLKIMYFQRAFKLAGTYIYTQYSNIYCNHFIEFHSKHVKELKCILL